MKQLPINLQESAMPQRRGSPHILGRETVLHDDFHAGVRSEISRIESGLEWMADTEAIKEDPTRMGRLRKVANFMLGKHVMSDSEVGARDRMHQDDYAYRLEVYQQADEKLSLEKKAMLDGVRARLSESDPTRHKRVTDVLLTAGKMPDALMGKFIGWSSKEILDSRSGSMIDWMVRGTTDEELLEVLRWHNNRMDEQQQKPETQEMLTKGRSAFKEGIAVGIEQGWMHEEAQQAIQDIDSVTDYIGDEFDTLLRGVSGYHVRGESWVVVTRPETAMHEWQHAAVGELGPRWMNEAITQISAESVQEGELVAFDPRERYGDNLKKGSYGAEQYLLYAISVSGKDPVPLQLYTLGYSARSEQAQQEAGIAIGEAMNAAHGKSSFLAEISKVVLAREKEYMSDGYSRRQAQKQSAISIANELLLGTYKIYRLKLKRLM